MKSKGFTLVELLAVIVILSIIISLSVMAFGSISEREKGKIEDEKIDVIEKSGVLYLQDHRELFNRSNYKCNNSQLSLVGLGNDGVCTVISLGDLISANYINRNAVLNISEDLKIIVFRNNNRIYAKAVN